VTRGGGGGGGGTAGGAGGAGGGGAGGAASGQSGTAGTANTGGGGGGANNISPAIAAAGGSGIVIISYAGAQQFGGGVVTSSGGNTIHTFTTSGTLVPVTPLSANYLVVAGGGGAGNHGGGGAGGLLSGSGVAIDTNSTYLITVGAGGAGIAQQTTISSGTSGSNSQFLSVTSTGGGGGGSYSGSGLSGGSGGGSGGNFGGSPTGGAGTSGQGNAGGTASGAGGSGGGGASAVGSAGTGAELTGAGGNGGAGTASSISGSSVTYAGGGGGGGGDNRTSGTAGTGGSGGGGNGAAAGGSGTAATGSAGTANLGGGGGGGGSSNSTNYGGGGAGGSGVVIISYAGATQLMAGGTVTISGGNVIHTFTSTGFLAPLDFVGNSLRFRSSASAYLQRTPTVASNRKTYTWSGWVKRGLLTTGTYYGLFTAGQVTGGDDGLFYDAGAGGIYFTPDTGASVIVTTAAYRDPAAWYHVVIAVDTTQATASNRMKLYVNGAQVTAFSTAAYPAQNLDSTYINTANIHRIGAHTNAGYYFDGYMTEINFIDGQALTPNSFGTFNSYGVWQPITYGGSYGINGFYLPFTNTTSTTTLGFDFSPNGNNWTTNNISLTAGATYDSMTDVPTLTSATAANYCTFNPLWVGSGITTSNANLTATASSNVNALALSTIAVSSGKWYWETTVISGSSMWSGGAVNPAISTPNYSGLTTGNSYGFNNTSTSYNGQTGTTYGATYTTNDVIGTALDLDTGTITFYKNGVSQGVAYTGISGTFTPMVLLNTSSNSINFGQRPFAYTPPSGFVAINTYNL
jgi:hypothetical protein